MHGGHYSEQLFISHFFTVDTCITALAPTQWSADVPATKIPFNQKVTEVIMDNSFTVEDTCR